MSDEENLPECYKVFNWRALKEYLKIGIPNVFACSIEWWAYQIMHFASAKFGVSAQAA